MRIVRLAVLLLLSSFVIPAGGATEQAATYVGGSPYFYPDCVWSPTGKSLGAGGACFDVPAGADRYQVVIRDDVLGPGFGALHFSRDDGCCESHPICDGFAAGDVPPEATGAFVTVSFPPYSVAPWCGPAADAWAPTRGSITLALTAPAP